MWHRRLVESQDIVSAPTLNVPISCCQFTVPVPVAEVEEAEKAEEPVAEAALAGGAIKKPKDGERPVDICPVCLTTCKGGQTRRHMRSKHPNSKIPNRAEMKVLQATLRGNWNASTKLTGRASCRLCGLLYAESFVSKHIQTCKGRPSA